MDLSVSTPFYLDAIFVMLTAYSCLHYYMLILSFCCSHCLYIFHLRTPFYLFIPWILYFPKSCPFFSSFVFSLSLDVHIHIYGFSHNLYTEDQKTTVLIQNFPFISNAIISLLSEAQQASQSESMQNWPHLSSWIHFILNLFPKLLKSPKLSPCCWIPTLILFTEHLSEPSFKNVNSIYHFSHKSHCWLRAPR